MDEKQRKLIEAAEISVQEEFEKAPELLTKLSELQQAYGLKDQSLARKATLTGNVISIIDLFAKSAFKTADQRAAEAAQSALILRDKEDEKVRRYLEDREYERATPDQTKEAERIIAKRKKEKP